MAISTTLTISCASGPTPERSANWRGWTRRRNTFWKSPPSRTTLPARSAARNTATPTENIRSRKALCWCAPFSTEAQIARVAYLVGHHHTLRNIHGPDYQILIEADYIANASENGYSKQSVMHFIDTVIKTASGKHLAASVLGISASNLGCAGR